MRVFSHPLRFFSNFFWRYVHFCVILHPRKKTTAVVKSWSTRLTGKCYILCYRKTLADCQLSENKGDMSMGSQPSPFATKSNLTGCSFCCVCEPGSHVLSVAPLCEGLARRPEGESQSVPSDRAQIPLSANRSAQLLVLNKLCGFFIVR